MCFAALLAFSGCKRLERVAEDRCGNRVVESGEECDDASSPGCHPPGSEHACRFDCREQACPSGSACGVDAVCRRASGRFTAQGVDAGERYALLSVADVTGDRRSDLVVGTRRGVTLSFDGTRTERLTRNEAVAGDYTYLGEVDGAGRADLVSFAYGASEVQVLTADASGALLPVSHLVPAPEGEGRRVFSADVDGDGRTEPLLLVDADLYRVTPLLSEFDRLGATEVRAAQVAGVIPTGDFASQTPCDEFALAPRGGQTVHVYTLCGENGQPARLSGVNLPEGKQIGDGGAFAGDLDGDGALDLIITTLDSYELFVAYGLGDGTYDSQAGSPAGTKGDQRTAEEARNYEASLLGVAKLDADAKLDLMLDDRTLLTSKITPQCERPGDFSCLLFHDYWAAAVAGDFNRDGIVDQIGVPYEVRELTYALGTGDGFNEFSLPTRGFTALYDARPPRLGVGDFDGDLIADVSFTELQRQGEAGETLSVLYGQALGKPTELRRLSTENEVFDLCAGSLGGEGTRRMSDLVVLASNSAVDGVGLFAGQTNRLLFSPLPVPENPDLRVNLSLQAVALGRFRSQALGGDVASDEHPSPREDMAMLATNQRGDSLLYFVPNSPQGFQSAREQEPPLRLPAQAEGGYLSLVVMDLDADGVDELLVLGDHITGPRLPYWVVRRTEQRFVQDGFAAELPAFAEAARVTVSAQPHALDVTGDGIEDLLLTLQDESDPLGRYEAVIEGKDADRLGAVTLRKVPFGAAQAAGFWAFASVVAYLNIDVDPMRELAIVLDDRVGVYDVNTLTGELEKLLELNPGGYANMLVAGDFDGDGVEDLATSAENVTIFWGEARDP